MYACFHNFFTDCDQGHGLAAASGKVGAVLAQALTGPLRGIGFEKGKTDASPWLPHVIQILGAFAFLGWLCSFFIPETMNRSLEKLAGEEPGHEEDHQPQTFFELLWISCTPVVLYQWLFRNRGQPSSEEYDMDVGDWTTGEPRISSVGTQQTFNDPPRAHGADRGGLPESKEDGGLKAFETEVMRSLAGSSDGRDGSDEIERIT